MAIRGKDRRNAILEKLLRYLWVGDVVSASGYLASLLNANVIDRNIDALIWNRFDFYFCC